MQTSDLKIKKNGTQYAYDIILIKVAVVVTETAWCILRVE